MPKKCKRLRYTYCINVDTCSIEFGIGFSMLQFAFFSLGSFETSLPCCHQWQSQSSCHQGNTQRCVLCDRTLADKSEDSLPRINSSKSTLSSFLCQSLLTLTSPEGRRLDESGRDMYVATTTPSPVHSVHSKLLSRVVVSQILTVRSCEAVSKLQPQETMFRV